MRRTEREALALGLLHGPAELVPVSSSGHVTAVPWLLRWELAGWSGERRHQDFAGLKLVELLRAADHPNRAAGAARRRRRA